MTAPHARQTASDNGADPRREPVPPARRHYELYPPGILYLVITLFLAIGAVNSQNNLLFLAFGLSISGFLISGLVSGPPLMKIRARRLPPQPGAVGEHAHIRYTLQHHGKRLNAMGLQIREAHRKGEPPPTTHSPAPAGILCLRPGQTASATLRLTPDKRGVHSLTAFTISTTFPFGLFRKTLVFEQTDTWVVAPRRVALKPMPWHRAGNDGATLSTVAARRGQSTEFYALRAYTPGDPTRQIAWRPSARIGEIVIREQAASAPPKLWIRIDAPDHSTPAHLVERASALVAALAQDASQAGFSVGLQGEGLPRLRPILGPKRVRAIQTQMAQIGSDPHQGPSDEHTHAPPDHRALSVSIEYQRSARANGRKDFTLNAHDTDHWLATKPVPPEFQHPGTSTEQTRTAALMSRARSMFTDAPKPSTNSGAPT